MGTSVDSPVVSNGDLRAKKLPSLANGHGHHHPKAVPDLGEAKSPARNGVSIIEVEESDDEESSSGDEKAWQYAAEIPITQVDDRDRGTSDDWIPRHPELVRLTGRHPFNCEPPLSALMEVSHPLNPPSQNSINMSSLYHNRNPQIWFGIPII